ECDIRAEPPSILNIRFEMIAERRGVPAGSGRPVLGSINTNENVDVIAPVSTGRPALTRLCAITQCLCSQRGCFEDSCGCLEIRADVWRSERMFKDPCRCLKICADV